VTPQGASGGRALRRAARTGPRLSGSEGARPEGANTAAGQGGAGATTSGGRLRRVSRVGRRAYLALQASAGMLGAAGNGRHVRRSGQVAGMAGAAGIAGHWAAWLVRKQRRKVSSGLPSTGAAARSIRPVGQDLDHPGSGEDWTLRLTVGPLITTRRPPILSDFAFHGSRTNGRPMSGGKPAKGFQDAMRNVAVPGLPDDHVTHWRMGEAAWPGANRARDQWPPTFQTLLTALGKARYCINPGPGLFRGQGPASGGELHQTSSALSLRPISC